MQRHLVDIYTEPTDIDVDTLRNLGPLSGMAGIFEGIQGRKDPFHHRDRSVLKKVGEPTPNPLARGRETK